MCRAVPSPQTPWIETPRRTLALAVRLHVKGDPHALRRRERLEKESRDIRTVMDMRAQELRARSAQLETSTNRSIRYDDTSPPIRLPFVSSLLNSVATVHLLCAW